MDDPAKAKTAIAGKRKLAFSLSLFLLIMAGLEVGLRAAGLLAPAPLFTEFKDESGRDRVRVDVNALHEEFGRTKPAGTVRIMIAGGSTALGFPYQPRSSFGLRLRSMLAESVPDREVEIIHLGQVAWCSGEVALVVEAALRYEPDLIVVYSGHNEFISLPNRPGKAVGLLLRLRSVRAVGGAAAILAGRGRQRLMREWEERPEQGLADRSLNPISRSDYERAMAEYEKNLERIARAAAERKVPLVLCTMVSNLRDWPPELAAFPAGFTSEQKDRARQGYDRAMAQIEDGEYDEAITDLASLQADLPGYGPLAFARGRARTGLLVADMKEGDSVDGGRPRLLDPAAVRREALADFKQAIAEEALAVPTHRATPAQNGLIRKVAAREGAWLLDLEQVFDQSSYLTPGFDWFEDHCHPNLFGQQVMAEALAELLREHDFPVPAGQWRPAPPWNELDFQTAQGMDNDYLHHIDLYMAIYLGLNRFLPDRSAGTRERLQLAAERKPEDPLPLLLEALVALNYPGPDDSYSRLATLHRERPLDLDKAIARYTTSLVDLRQGVLMARLHQDLDLAPLSRMLRSGFFKQEQEDEDDKGLSKWVDFHNRFIDLDAGGLDVTNLVQQGVKARDLTEGAELQLLNDETAKVLFPSPGAGIVSMAHGVKYQITSPAAFLSTGPVKIVPGRYGELEINLIRDGEPADDMVLAFAYEGWDGAAGYGRIKISPDANGHFLTHLWYFPRWAMARRVIEMRLLPNLKSGTVTINSLDLFNTPP